MLVQSGKITTQDYDDLISALNPKIPVEIREETREERIQRWEALLESEKISEQDFRDLLLAEEALER